MDQQFLPESLNKANSKKQKPKKKKPNMPWIYEGRWSAFQNLAYYQFIKHHRDLFQSEKLRKTKKVFQRMSNKVKTRSAGQCRSHHQKMIDKHLNQQRIMNSLEIELGIKKNTSENDIPQVKSIHSADLQKVEGIIDYEDFLDGQNLSEICEFKSFSNKNQMKKQELYNNIDNHQNQQLMNKKQSLFDTLLNQNF